MTDRPDHTERIVPLRLQKFLARAGVASRRGSENLMTAGRVRVNGSVVTELGSKVDPRIDVVEVDGKVIEPGGTSVTLVLNKPVGYLTTMSDPQGRSCVAELVPRDEYPGLYPIGRLDKDTSGVLLFSTEGELGHNLLHPSKLVWKCYEAQVEGTVLPGQVKALEAGIELDDGPAAPARVELLSADKLNSVLRISIHEGRNRQVRRMCQAIGHPVLALKRLSFGPITLGDLQPGSWRMLNEAESEALREHVS